MSESHAADLAHCEALLREGDRDRWLASLFIPADRRSYVQALYAFSLEIAGIAARVSEPMLGEIRLQWWREALIGERAAEAAAHPVAAALLATIGKFALPQAPFLALIDARLFDLYHEPMPTIAALEAYARATASGLFRLALQVAAAEPDPRLNEAAEHAGIAYALTGLMRALPWHAASGRFFAPVECLAAHGGEAYVEAGRASASLRAALADLRRRARDHLQKFDALAAKAKGRGGVVFLPVRLCEPCLRQMERPDYDPLRTLIELPQWRRQWILWRAARKMG
jgi:15-cis-phytoene synthase